MNGLKGFPLRKLNGKDHLWMWALSPLVLQMLIPQLMIEVTRGNVGQEQVILGAAIGSVISLPILFYVIVKRKIPIVNRKKRPLFSFGLSKKDWLFLLWYIPVAMIVFSLGAQVVYNIFGEPEAVNQQAVESMATIVPLWLMFIMVVISAPLVEEWLFRGLLLFHNPTKEVSWFWVIVSAVLFGLVHTPTDIASAYTYMGMGLMFGYAVKHTGSVEAAVVFHFINNALAFTQLL